MSDAVYPYRVEYLRTKDWYIGRWRDMSNWCNECIGAGEWEYYGDTFVFTEEKYMMMFKLRWM